jgi:hypothetical protein
VLVACCVVALFSSSARAAEEEPTKLSFNPALSLTGDCKISELDLVPDPGCPGGTHPPAPISNPGAIATDSYGDVYVASVPQAFAEDEGRIIIFDAQGAYLSQFEVDIAPRSMAVDSKGNLYVSGSYHKFLRVYEPTAYAPLNGGIAYSSTPARYISEGGNWPQVGAVAVNPLDDHLFVNFGGPAGLPELGLGFPPDTSAVVEFGSAEEGNPLLDRHVVEKRFLASTMAIDASRGRLYVSNAYEAGPNGERHSILEVYELAPPHNLIKVIDGSSLPDGEFLGEAFIFGGVDESSGHLFAYEPEFSHSIFELTSEGAYLQTIKHGFSGRYRGLAVDNGIHSPNGAENLKGRTIWATSAAGSNAPGHAFAFGPPTQCSPTVESTAVDHVGETEALVKADIEPCELETSYRVEYVTQEQFAQSEFENAAVAGEGTIPAAAAPVAVSVGAVGLAPGTAYRFRVVATNSLGDDESIVEFRTYPAASPPSACSNDALRTGRSRLLPDCRAYELVTPPDTNGLTPNRLGLAGLPTVPVSLAGDKASFTIAGGLIPGGDGTGSLKGDPYIATRGPGGWSTENAGGSGPEATTIIDGGRSTDLSHSLWWAEGEGPAVIAGAHPGEPAAWVRYPDGHSELMAQGELGADPHPGARLISPGGGHMIFTSAVQLEEEAPPAPFVAIYDRTSDGVTHVVSILPDGTTALGPIYRGASADGKGIAFGALKASEETPAPEEEPAPEEVLYLRYNNEETFEIAKGRTVVFEGIATGGRRIFYLEEGNLFAFDVEGGVVPFATSGDATVVNLSTDGSAAYFVSPSKLTAEPNPVGQKAKLGKQNLYLSREGSISYVGTVTEADVFFNTNEVEGLGTWWKHRASLDPSRTTADGSVIVFQSRANLTGEEAAAHPQVYRYDSTAAELRCLSCVPTGLPAAAGAQLETSNSAEPDELNNNGNELVENLAADGRRVFFESDEPLVAADTDGLRDVYEWEADGKGTCAEPGGCIFLISSGGSAENNYLYGVSETGNDVFIRTSDLLTREDADATPSIYDARVNGGFPAATSNAECLGEACQPAATPPERPAQVLVGAGNVGKAGRPCPKGKHAVRRKGRRHCVKPHRHQHRKHRGGKGRPGARATNNGREQR